MLRVEKREGVSVPATFSCDCVVAVGPCARLPTDCLHACWDVIPVWWCAGVWEFITSKEAIELVGDCETPEEACRVVSAAAGKAGGSVRCRQGRGSSQQKVACLQTRTTGYYENDAHDGHPRRAQTLLQQLQQQCASVVHAVSCPTRCLQAMLVYIGGPSYALFPMP